MLISAYAKVIATHVAVEIVIECALLPVFKQDADKAGSTDKDRSHFFDDNSTSPLAIVSVDHAVSKSEVEAFVVHLRPSSVNVRLVVAENTSTNQDAAFQCSHERESKRARSPSSIQRSTKLATVETVSSAGRRDSSTEQTTANDSPA
jgi:hypothetical protein